MSVPRGFNRKFDGKWFQRHDRHGTKKAANDVADELRRKGYLVRVVKKKRRGDILPYQVYTSYTKKAQRERGT